MAKRTLLPKPRRYNGELVWRFITPVSRNGSKPGNKIKLPKIVCAGLNACFGNMIPGEIIRFIGIVFLRKEISMKKTIWHKEEWYDLQLLLQLKETAVKISSKFTKGERKDGDGLTSHHNIADARGGNGKDNLTDFPYHFPWHDIFDLLTPQEAIRLIKIVFFGSEIGCIKRVWSNKDWTDLQQMIMRKEKPFKIKQRFQQKNGKKKRRR